MFGSRHSSRTRSGSRARALVVAGAMVATAALSACGGMPGTAATVDGNKISDSEVSQTMEDYNSFATDASQKMTAPAALNELIKAELADQVMADRGLSQSEFDKFYDEGVNPEAKKNEKVSELARELLKTPFVASKVGEEELKKEFSGADVTVNPRYGSWGEGVLNPTSGSLSVASKPQGQ